MKKALMFQTRKVEWCSSYACWFLFLGDHPGCLKTTDPKSMVDVGISYIYICGNTSHLYYKPRSFCKHLFIILLAGAQVLIANDMKWKDRTIEAAA